MAVQLFIIIIAALLALWYHVAMNPLPHPLTAHVDLFLDRIATPAYARQDQQGYLRHALSKDAGLLAKAFNTRALPLNRHQQPALALAAQFNLRAIGKKYRLPPGLTAARLEAYVLAQRWAAQRGLIAQDTYAENLRETCALLSALNPTLTRLQFDRGDTGRLFDLLMGVSSGFNPDDIQFYLAGNYYSVAMMQQDYAAKNNAAQRCLGTDIGWVPSPRTLDKIIRQRKP